jgi:signal transduction histidine kinase
VVGITLAFSALFNVKDATHLTDIIWIFVCIWLAYVGLGKRIGIVFLSVAALVLSVYIFFYSNENILSMIPRNSIDLFVVAMETLCACFAFGYLTSVFVGMQKQKEAQIQQKSEEILTLNSTIHSNERMVALGDMTMGLAHDLNSPLSSVKFGVANLRESLSNLLEHNFHTLPQEEMKEIYSFSTILSKRQMIGGINAIKMKQELQSFIEERKHFDNSKNASEFADILIKCGITGTDLEIIDCVLRSKNPTDYLATLRNMVVIFQMLNIIHHAGNQSSEVITSLRNFTNSAKLEKPELIQLKENVGMVLQILISRFTETIEIAVDIPEDLTVMALPRDLFQIWSNILKNALEALENKEKGIIRINAKRTDDGSITVSFSNNGPKIPEESRTKIFDRFTSSKSIGNLGFGLHIVMEIIKRNNWTIAVESDDQVTSFHITLRDSNPL